MTRVALFARLLLFVGFCGSLVPRLASAEADPSGTLPPLGVEEVLESARAHYPMILAAEADRRAAEGLLRAARGGFDTRVKGEADLRPDGFYENYGGEASVEQPTTFWGARFFGGYRLGQGDFPSYDGARQTDEDGEFFGGVEVPLVRGGPIDAPRARLRQARLDLDRAGIDVFLQQIAVQLQATVAYWDWLAAELAVEVERGLLEVAELRQSRLEGRVSRGILPRIDLSDNERLIVDRRIRLRGAERDAEQAAIGLSLFFRDEFGDPVVASAHRTPPDGFPPEDQPDRYRLEQDIARVSEQHPLLASLRLEIDRASVELELARNQALPAIDLRVEGSRDEGSADPGLSTEGTISPNPRSETEIKALVRFEMPVQRRDALGRAEAARAKLQRLENRRRLAGDRLIADARRAMAGLAAAFDQTTAARRNLELALELQRAEERRLSLGSSNLIDVNIREIQAAEANRSLIDAQAKYFRAVAEYRAAVAVGS